MDIERPETSQPLPPGAKKVFQGEIFEVYQWEQKLFDGSTATFEKLKRSDTTSIIPITTDGKILLCAQEQPGKTPFTGVPGGRLEPGEDPLEGARRELREETGYDSDDIALWYAFQPTSKLDWAIYVFIARNCRKIGAQNLDPGEKIELKPLGFEEFIDAASQDESFLEIDVALRLARAKNDPAKMAKIKKLFGVK